MTSEGIEVNDLARITRALQSFAEEHGDNWMEELRNGDPWTELPAKRPHMASARAELPLLQDGQHWIHKLEEAELEFPDVSDMDRGDRYMLALLLYNATAELGIYVPDAPEEPVPDAAPGEAALWDAIDNTITALLDQLTALEDVLDRGGIAGE